VPIQDQKPIVSIQPVEPYATERPVTPGVIRVHRGASAPTPLTVRYTVSGTATPGVDYTALPGSITIPANAASADIRVTPIPDALAESSETVVVSLEPDPAYTLGGRVTMASVTITPLRPAGISRYRGGAWGINTSKSGAFTDCSTLGDTCVTWLGLPNERPVAGDWNGDGKTDIGVYVGGYWILDVNGNRTFDGCETDRCVLWCGLEGEIPVVGDWNGDGKTEIGVYANGVWYLDYNGNGTWDGCTVDKCLAWFGLPDEQPVVGDWNGDGKTKIGVYVNGTWILDYNGNGAFDGCTTDRCLTWLGLPNEQPIVGDWNGDGKTKIGIYVDGMWALDYNGDGLYDNCTVDKCSSWSNLLSDLAGATPLIGDWTGDGKAKLGLRVGDGVYLDWDGNGIFEFTTSDRYFLGLATGDIPVVGKW
jgi:hypothetical protein